MKEVLRTCYVCKTKQNKNNMNRIVNNDEGFILDNKKQHNGRAFYVCKNDSCVENIIKKRVLNRVAKTNVEDKVYLELVEELKNCK